MNRTIFEKFLFASRWLLTPFYVGLALTLVALLGKMAEHIYKLALGFQSFSEEDVLLSTLGVVDLTLSAMLIVIVMLSGYTNFVSPIVQRKNDKRPTWVADIDFSELKLKLMASIVAISAIKLLEAFMNVDHETDREMGWLVGVHIAFVVSALLLAVADRVGHGPAPAKPAGESGNAAPPPPPH